MPFTIGVLLKNRSSVVVTHSPEIVLIIEKLFSSVEVHLIKSPSPVIGWRFFSALNNVLESKKENWRLIKRYNNREVYFGFVAFANMEAWLIGKLSRGNKILCYANKVRSENSMSTRLAAYKFLVWLCYGLRINTTTSNGRLIPTLRQKYFNQFEFVSSSKKKEYATLASDYVSNKLSIVSGRILLLLGKEVENGMVDKGEYESLFSDLLNQGSYGKIIVKAHPRRKQTMAFEESLANIPNYIPANLILEHFQVVIGLHSAVLFEAANKGLVSISILSLVKMNPELKFKYSEYLTANSISNDIHFPSTFGQFLTIIGKSDS